MSATVTSVAAAPIGWENDPRYVYIGRPGKGLSGPWGNPFNTGTRAEKIARYEEWMRKRLAAEPDLRKRVAALHGKILVCFCFPLTCHGDVLARLAEEEVETKRLNDYLRKLGFRPTTTLDPED